MIRCVFFDRDGIVNASPGPGYVESWADFKLLPPFLDALEIVRDAGSEAVIVTNQRGVALGRMSLRAVKDIHENLRRVLKAGHGLDVLDILCCPHDRGECDCRKPQPGMLLEAARRHAIDLSLSWMVGDSESDVEAGRRAGCRTIRVCGPEAASAADLRAPRLEALPQVLRSALL